MKIVRIPAGQSGSGQGWWGPGAEQRTRGKTGGLRPQKRCSQCGELGHRRQTCGRKTRAQEREEKANGGEHAVD